LKLYKEKIKTFFSPQDGFEEEQWILRHKISALLVVSFFLGVGIFLFALYRVTHGNVFAGIAQFLFSIFLLTGFVNLRKHKSLYRVYSILFFVLFFIYIHIVFFFVPENQLNILWIVTSPVLIFFFLDKKGGMIIFFLLLGFVVYLLLIRYPYTEAEYITLLTTLATTTLIMYSYEKIKDKERSHLLSYNLTLKNEIEKKTESLRELNTNLEVKVEEEITKRMLQEDMLLRQGRMASMGEMIDSIAHQWRQPLMNINVVLMNLDRGVDTNKDSEYLKEKIIEVFSLTSHMSTTIEDFRNLLKSEKKRQEFNVVEVVSDVLSLMKNNLKGINVSIVSKKSILIKSCRSEFSQVVITLLSNASEVLNSKRLEDKKIHINIEQNSKETKLVIGDNGGGIDEKNLGKIFDPYFTTKEQTGGTGLGLYITKIIVERSMKGDISVYNRKNGAIFCVILPIS